MALAAPVLSCLRLSQPPSHYDVILIITSFATELATPGVMDVRYVCTDTLPCLIYEDNLSFSILFCLADDCYLSIKSVRLILGVD